MRFIVTTTEFEFHEKVYIVDAEDDREALALVRRDSTAPLIDSLAKRTIIDPVTEPLREHPSYVIVKEATRAGTRNMRPLGALNEHEAKSGKGE